MDKNIIFFGALGECFKDDACDVFLVESEGSVVGPADEVVGVFGLDDTWFPGHALGGA